jgi:hypothetical protein
MDRSERLSVSTIAICLAVLSIGANVYLWFQLRESNRIAYRAEGVAMQAADRAQLYARQVSGESSR